MVIIAVAGGSGDLGKILLNELIASKKHVIYVLSRRAKPAEGPDSPEHLAVDYTSVEALKKVLQDKKVEAVVSALNLYWEGVPAAQLNLIRAAAQSGSVSKFVPSEFNLDYKLPDDILVYPPKLQQIEAAEELAKYPHLSWTLLRNGIFLDYLGLPYKPIQTSLTPLWLFLDLDHKICHVPEEGTQTLVLSHSSDVAKYLERLICLPGEQWPRESAVIGNKLQPKDIAGIAERITGQKFETVFDTMDNIRSGKPAVLPSNTKQEVLGGDMETLNALVAGTILAAAGNGYDIPGTDLSTLFPDVQKTTIEDFLKACWALKMGA